MKEAWKAFTTIYRALPRWAQWTIPVVVLALIIAAAGSSSSKKAAPRATAKATPISNSKPTGNKTATTATGWPSKRDSKAQEAQKEASHRRYVAHATGVCVALNHRYGAGEKKQAAELDQLLRSGEPEAAREAETQAVTVLTFTATERAKALSALKPPGEDQSVLAEIVKNSNERASHLKQAAQVIAQGESGKDIEQALVLVRDDGSELEGLVERAGLPKCAGE